MVVVELYAQCRVYTCIILKRANGATSKSAAGHINAPYLYHRMRSIGVDTQASDKILPHWMSGLGISSG